MEPLVVFYATSAGGASDGPNATTLPAHAPGAS